MTYARGLMMATPRAKDSTLRAAESGAPHKAPAKPTLLGGAEKYCPASGGKRSRIWGMFAPCKAKMTSILTRLVRKIHKGLVGTRACRKGHFGKILFVGAREGLEPGLVEWFRAGSHRDVRKFGHDILQKQDGFLSFIT